MGGRREDAFNPSFDALKVRARPAAHASAQRPPRTSYLIGLLRPQVGAIIQLPWAIVVMQPWLRERRLSVGAAARGQYYLSDVNFGAPPPLGPHFPRPIRPEPPLSPPSSALTEPCMPLSGTANGAGTAADGTVGTARTPGIAAAAAAAAAAFSGRADAAFSSILGLLNLPPRRCACSAGRNMANGWLGRLPGGAERRGPGQMVGWGHVGANGGGSGGCWEPQCASACAF